MSNRGSALFWLLASTLTVTFLAGQIPTTRPKESADQAATLLRPAFVMDSSGPSLRSGWAVLVTGEKIRQVGPLESISKPPGTIEVDLPGLTLLPGLIEGHAHIFLHPYNETLWDDQVLKESLAYRTLLAGEHCRATLLAGFTTLRDLGTEGAGFADVGVQKAINDGIIPGPRLQVATRAIVATASYAPGPRGYAPEFETPKGAQEATGTAEIVKAVREQIGHGAEWVKVYADFRRGPGMTLTPTFSVEELKALVDEAHSAGCRVSAHAAGSEGIRRALEAGVDTIEHGNQGDEAAFKLMAEKGAVYFPTLAAVEAYCEYFQGYTRGATPWPDDLKQAEKAFRLALKSGVTIGCGGDVGVFKHGENYRELEWMVAMGMTPAQAFLAATQVNARAFRLEDRVGEIRPGLYADLIAVQGNPLEDIKVLRKVVFVAKGGKIVKRP